MGTTITSAMSSKSDALDSSVRSLFNCGRILPLQVRDQIRSFGSAAIEPLLRILQDEELLDSTAPGAGWAPIHALELLVDLRAVEATEAMLRTLAATDWMSIAHDRLIVRMPELGPPVLEPALRAYAESENDDFRDSICAIVARLAIRDERIFELLLKQLERDIASGAMSLAEYADPRAIPHLSDTLDECEIDDSGPFANSALFELVAAIEDLGGLLTASQRRKMQEAELLADVAREVLNTGLRNYSASKTRRYGRNDLCWCGSGKKYKKCHLRGDETRS